MTKITVIHHSADFDGLFCREIARKFLPDAEFIGWDYNDPKIPFPDDGIVYVLDLSPDCFNLTKDNLALRSDGGFDGNYNRLIWIDHHKSAIEKHHTFIPGYRIDGVSACRLTWQWFFNQPPMDVRRMEWLPTKKEYEDRIVSEPYAVRLAGEYDIWDKRDPNADAFQFGLRSRTLTPEIWSQLLDNTIPKELQGTGMEQTNSDLATCSLLEDGRLLMRYQREADASTVNHRSFIIEWEGLKFLALTTARCNSMTFDAKDVPETGHDALMALYYNGSAWSVSLYHAKHRKDIDLSVIASKYGGGGHRGACGFRINQLPFLNKEPNAFGMAEAVRMLESVR